MIKSKKIEECFKGLIGWRNHYDATEIPDLPVGLNASSSNQFFQDIHPALRLDLIK